MPRSVDEVERKALVIHLDGMALDGDATLFLQVHVVEHLVFHLAHVHRSGEFQHAVGQGALAVIYMCNNTKITYLIHNRLQNYYNFLIYANNW